MEDSQKIDSKDVKLISWLMLPGFLAFGFLGLISGGSGWIYWFMLFGGAYLSALIGWHLYKYYVISRTPSSKVLFYSNYIFAQITLVLIVYIFIRVKYAI